MIYQELFPTEIGRQKVKEQFKRLLQAAGGSAPLIQTLFDKAIDPFQEKIAQLPQLEPAQLESEFVGMRRGIHELKYYIAYLFQAEKELSLSSPKEVQQSLLAQCDAYLHEIAPYLPAVLKWRRENLPQHFELQVRSALLKLGDFFKENPEEIPEIPQFLDEHANALQKSVDYLQSNFEMFERIVLEQGRSILTLESQESPFKLLYSYSGALYIIMEIAEHLIGHGGGKICSRAIFLQTGEIVAFVRPRILFAEGLDAAALAVERKLHFERTLKESDLLLQLHEKKGIVHLRERFFFNMDEIPRVFLIEDLYPDGALSSLLPKRKPLSLNEQYAIAKEILTGVANLHAQHIAHADITPDNVLVNLRTSPLQAALCDFNSAFDTRTHHTIPQLQKNHPPEYMPLLAHKVTDTQIWEKIDPKPVDIWEAGTTLYTLFFRVPLPWAHLNDPLQIIQEISELKEDWIPAEYKEHPFAPLIQAMLAVNPAQRPTASDALFLLQSR